SVADGRPLPRLDLGAARELDIGLRPLHVRVAPDGKTLTVLAWPRLPEYRYRKYSFSFWDLGTGRLCRWGGDPGNAYRGALAARSPDGRFAARDGALFDTRTGARRELSGDVGRWANGVHLFAPDGRLLAADREQGVHVWEVATGRTLTDLPGATVR